MCVFAAGAERLAVAWLIRLVANGVVHLRQRDAKKGTGTERQAAAQDRHQRQSSLGQSASLVPFWVSKTVR